MMSDLDDYLTIKRRNKTRKQVRKLYPHLMGQQLEDMVDRKLSISDSGNMEWAEIKAPTKSSDYPTPDSIKESHVRKISKKFGVRPYKLYWLFVQKVTKYQASGKEKHDYLAVLKECAASAVKNKLKDNEKITAVLFFSKFAHVMITHNEAKIMLEEGKL